MKIRCFFIILITFTLNTTLRAKEPHLTHCPTPIKAPHVVFIVPGASDSHFWSKTVALMQKASNQLKVSLTIYYINNNEGSQVNYPATVEKIINKTENIDYLMSFLPVNATERIIRLINRKKIKLFTINSPLTKKIIDTVGKPREKNKLWIGHMAPDDYLVGYQLADNLINNAPKSAKNIRMIAINGDKSNLVSTERERGLQNRIQESTNVTLLQVVYTDWSQESSTFLVEKLIERFKTFDLVWSADDHMAIGAILAINKHPEFNNKVVKIGTINWSKKALDLIKNNTIEVTFGGHVLQGAYVITKLFDHFNGHDFLHTTESVIKTTLFPMTLDLLHKENITDFSDIDFTLMSHCLTEGVTENYQFNPVNILLNQTIE